MQHLLLLALVAIISVVILCCSALVNAHPEKKAGCDDRIIGSHDDVNGEHDLSSLSFHQKETIVHKMSGIKKTVLVIGANGLTGRRLVSRLATDPRYSPIAMIRSAAQAPFFHALHVPTRVGDLEYPIDHVMTDDVDVVMFAAGSGSKTGTDKTALVDYVGAIRAVVAAQQSKNVNRFIMLSATNVSPTSQSAIKAYHRAKFHADEFVRDSATYGRQLEWTIVCPSRLTDDAGSGRVDVGPEVTVSRSEPVAPGSVFRPRAASSRDNVAEAMIAAIDEPRTFRRTFRLLDGDIPIAEALASLA